MWAAQEAVALGQDLEDTFTNERLALFEQLLLDAEGQGLVIERVTR